MTDKKSPGHRMQKIKSFLIHHICVTLLAVGIMAFFAAITVGAKPLDPVRRAVGNFSFTDIYYEIQKSTSEPDTSRIITIVDLTRLTNRADIAQTLRDIEAAHPKVIAVDATFDNIGEDFEANEALIDVVGSFDNIVYARKMLDWSGNDSIGWKHSIRSFFTEIVDVKEGTVNMPRGGLYDSMKRQVPMCETYLGKQYPSIVSQVANIFAGRELMKGHTEDLNINFSPTSFRKLQPEEVKDHPEMIEDQIVMFGALYDEKDNHWTPVGNIAGIELLAYGVQTLVFSNEIKTVNFLPTCLISLIMIFLMQLLQNLYLSRTLASKNLFVKYVVGSTYVLNIITFLFTSVFIGISFLVFKKFGISFNLAWGLSVIAFLGTSRSMFAAIKDYFIAVKDKYNILRNNKL